VELEVVAPSAAAGVQPLVEPEPAIEESAATPAEPALAKDPSTPENATENPEEALAKESLVVPAIDLLAMAAAPINLPESPKLSGVAEAVKPIAVVIPDPTGGIQALPSVAKPASPLTELGQSAPLSQDKTSLPGNPSNPLSDPLTRPTEPRADAPTQPNPAPTERQPMRTFDQPERSFLEKIKQFLRL
jgi:hypothetical protein